MKAFNVLLRYQWERERESGEWEEAIMKGLKGETSTFKIIILIWYTLKKLKLNVWDEMEWDEIDKIHLWGETNAFYLFFEPIKLGWGSEWCILLFDCNTNGAKSERDNIEWEEAINEVLKKEIFFFFFWVEKKVTVIW